VEASSDAPVTASVQAILTRRNRDGSFYYSHTEVRDFIAVCVIELGLPMAPQLRPMLAEFMQQLDVPAGSDESIYKAAYQAYFAEHPLNPTLTGAFEELGRMSFIDEHGGFRDKAFQRAALLSVGSDDETRAPGDGAGASRRSHKLKRGL
jgi:hypothetical protein